MTAANLRLRLDKADRVATEIHGRAETNTTLPVASKAIDDPRVVNLS